MEYLTEKRGGYDEWGDSWTAIRGVRLEDGREFQGHVINGKITDNEGRELEVELPMRKDISAEVTIERYEDGYEVWRLSLREFEDAFDEEKMTLTLPEK